MKNNKKILLPDWLPVNNWVAYGENDFNCQFFETKILSIIKRNNKEFSLVCIKPNEHNEYEKFSWNMISDWAKLLREVKRFEYPKFLPLVGDKVEVRHITKNKGQFYDFYTEVIFRGKQNDGYVIYVESSHRCFYFDKDGKCFSSRTGDKRPVEIVPINLKKDLNK